MNSFTLINAQKVVARWLRKEITVRKIAKHENGSIRIYLNGIAGNGPKTAYLHPAYSGAGYLFCYATMSIHGSLEEIS